MDQEKKVVFLSGSIQLPLKVGEMALMFHNGLPIRTSVVMAIQQISDDLIVFETRNSTYCVAPKIPFAQSVFIAQSAVCA